MDWYTVYEDLKKRNWVTLLILSSIGYFFLSPSLTLGIILGGFVIIANFKVFQHTICKAFSPKALTWKVSIIAKYYFRLLIMGIIIYLMTANELVDPIGLGIGLSTVVISIITFGISRALTTSARGAT